MNSAVLLIAILIPLIGGFTLFGGKTWSYKKLQITSEVLVVLTSLLVWCIILHRPEEEFLFFQLTGNLRIILKLDGLGCIFAGLVSFLWPFANLYAFEYMSHDEKRRHTFFGFYTMTYGVTLGIAFAGNILSMYFFYEMLTLVTVYLVMHPMHKKAIRASRVYLYYSLGGAAFAFLSIICLTIFGDAGKFVLGGVLDMQKVAAHPNWVLTLFLLAFCGFGVKAAVFPFHGWLPKASVAPTPVTALLHAVAVVKSGAFALIRIIYYSYGTDFLRGSWAQYAVMAMAMVTILYASTMAVKEIHLKRRLAYSTISNLSYILLGAALMTPLGMIGAIAHLLMHAFMKICGFFCVGAVMHQTGRNYISEIEGLGRKMPVIFGCFTVAAVSLAGIPPFAGFISKWSLGSAALASGQGIGYAAMGVLLYSAFMTAIYMGTIALRGWFPKQEATLEFTEKDTDPGWKMKLPIVLFAVMLLGLGLCAKPILEIIKAVAYGNF